MCETVHTPATVTNKPKIYGVAIEGEAPPTGSSSFHRWSIMGDLYVY